jgi:hypothetical protein
MCDSARFAIPKIGCLCREAPGEWVATNGDKSGRGASPEAAVASLLGIPIEQVQPIHLADYPHVAPPSPAIETPLLGATWQTTPKS